MKKWQEKIMAERLIHAMEHRVLCAVCPYPYRWKYDLKCPICSEFIGQHFNGLCPCRRFGNDTARKMSWIVLEEKGYLD